MSIWGIGDTGLGAQPAAFGAAEGNPSGYQSGAPAVTRRNEVVFALIVVAVILMLFAGVIVLRMSGEIVI